MAIYDTIGEPIENLACSNCGTEMEVAGIPSFTLIRCVECGQELSIPRQLGAFLLLKFLGKGGMGAVFLGYDPKLGRQCAIKVLGEMLGEDTEAVDNFLREARSAAQINSPNVVQIYQVGEENNVPFIVMELINGGQLDKQIEECPLDEIRALEVCRDAANGLLAAQAMGFFHGDIKPENILFDGHQVAKIADFGLAQFLQRGKKSKPGEIWGTPYYIAPEKARRQQEDYRSDIYSLGATLFHAVTGQPPFEGETAAEVVIARLKELPPDVRDLRADLHEPTAELVARMLDPDPGRRYPNYTSLLSDIEDVIRRVKECQRDEALALQRRQRKKKRLILAAILLALAVPVALLLKGRTPPDIPRAQDEQITREVIDWTRNVFRYQPAALHSVDQKMRSIASELPANQRGRDWLDLLRGGFLALARNLPEMSNTLIRVAHRPIPADERNSNNPDYYPVRLAAFMLSDETTLRTPSTQWPSWYVAISDYFAAVKALTTGDYPGAQRQLESYLRREWSSGEMTWPYAYRETATMLNEEIRRWQTRHEQIERLIERNMMDRAWQTFERATETEASPLFAPFVEQLRNRLTQAAQPPQPTATPPPAAHRPSEEDDREDARRREREDAEQREREEARRREEEERRRIIEQDNQRFSDLRTQAEQLLRRREFAEALQETRRRSQEMQTDDGRARAENLTQLLESISQLHADVLLLLGRVTLPAAINRGLGGPPKGADERGIVITLTHGETIKAWDTISNPNYIQLAEALISRSRMPPSRQAERYLAMALFMRIIDAPEHRIAPYEEAARNIDPAVYNKLGDYKRLLE